MQNPPPLTKYQKEYASYLSIASNVPNATFVLLHALLGHRVTMEKRLVISQMGQVRRGEIKNTFGKIDREETASN